MPTTGTSGGGTYRPAARPAARPGSRPGLGTAGSGASGRGAAGGFPGSLPAPDNRQQKQAKKILMTSAQMAALRSSLRSAGLFINSRHLEMLSPPTGISSLYQCEPEKSPASGVEGISIFHITKLMFNENEDSFEKMVSLYSALNTFGATVAMILQSDGIHTELFLCTSVSGRSRIAGDILEGNLRGQFPGCEIIPMLDESEKEALLSSFEASSRMGTRVVRSLSMIPSRREDERQKGRDLSAQGLEKFIDAMSGRQYTLVIISQPVSPDAMDECREGLEDMYTSLTPYAKEQVSYGDSETETVGYAISNSINNSVSRSISKSFGTSHTSSISQGRSANRGSGYEFFGIHFNDGTGTNSGMTSGDGTTTGTGSSQTESDTTGVTDSDTSSTATGSTRTLTLTRDNKAVGSLLMKIDEHIKRIHSSQTFGMWNSACYLIADDVPTATMGTSTLASLYAGDSAAAPRAYYNQWDASRSVARDVVLSELMHLRHPRIRLTIYEEETDANGKVIGRKKGPEQIVTPAVMVSGREVPILMGLPRKSVTGIVVDSMAEFGRNISETWVKKVSRPVSFGTIWHMGQEEKTGTQTFFDLDAFASHVFICGASGSGKSNTTYNLLEELIRKKIPFLVIEPAKGEYKTEFAGLPGVSIFTAQFSAWRQLRINPFEFHSGIHIREHLDNLVQVVSACWPLYGAMPGILKQAFERAYIDHGWDLTHSQRIEDRGSRFPVFKDLITALNSIITASPYSPQTKGDYRGALVNRVSSLCNGFEGEIFGSSIGVPDRILFGTNTIVDLSSIGSDETRSLIMGILIIRLREYRKMMSSGPNSQLVHVTVLEEAHNILKRCSQETNVESGNVQGAAVGSLCRCIAEMRSSGEGFMIIDQSPSAVDDAAIKNTAIKIVMRLPSKDDCVAMGTALSLNDDQIRELSRLDIGVAAVFHVGWTDTVLAKMGKIWSKKYRLSRSPELNLLVYRRIQGAVVQLMYQSFKDGGLTDIMVDIRDLLDVLCSSSLALRPSLPSSKKEELLEQVKVFADNYEISIKQGDRDNQEIGLSEFIVSFLGLESVFEVYPLPPVENGMTMGLEKDDIARIMAWEKELRRGVVRYMQMPEAVYPVKTYQWPVNPEKAEHFWNVYSMALHDWCYRSRDGFAYMNTWNYFCSSKYFQRIARGR